MPQPIRNFSLAIPVCLVIAFALARPTVAADVPPSPDNLKFFEEQVKPLLQANCLKCHGGEAKYKGGLRLTTRQSILKGGDQGAVVVLEDADKSLLLSAISYAAELKMPPTGKLAPENIAILNTWVRSGLAWTPGLDLAPNVIAQPTSGRPDPPTPAAARKSLWSVQPVKRPLVPQVKEKAWVHNPVDAFILAKLEAHGFKPAPAANKISLLRRATYDLTGLPPTPAEVDAFLADNSPTAYEKVIDRLLASPHYGEKWGRHWLDLVRYAESNSYERDNTKPNVWRYRDYVIRSFNEDKPYDQFVKEQLAGDEMPQSPGNYDPIIATGFYRLGIWDDEPTDRLQARYDNLDDIVVTTGQVFMGLTIDCARCHNHKIDPILQTDYYRLLAFFQNINTFHNGGKGDEVEIFGSPDAQQRFEAGEAANKEKIKKLKVRQAEIEKQFVALYQAVEHAPAANADMTDLHYRYYHASWQHLPDFDALKPDSQGMLRTSLFDTSLRSRETEFGFVFTGSLIVPQNGDYTFYLDSDDGSRLTIDGRPLITYDGIHGTGKEKHAVVSLKQGKLPIKLEYFQNHNGLGLNVAWSGPGFVRRALSAPMSGRRGKNAKIPDPIDDVKGTLFITGRQFLPIEVYHEYGRINHELTELEAPAHYDRALCVSEHGSSVADTYVCMRGNANVPGEKVQPGFPSVLADGDAVIPKPARDAKTSGRRTVLADWITSDADPLFARVMANRVFQYHFGRGIVRSPNNFGVQGDNPTHPELLDWLASELRSKGMHLKPLHRLIMLSSAYQMSTEGDPAALAADPQNDLLWRFDMRRLSAEELRDSILAVNGTLNLDMFGPSVYPDIPAEVKAGQSQPGRNWLQSTPDEKCRRSVYVHQKRSLQVPILQAFDAAEMDRSCPVRFVTIQPTQALGMMNGQFLNEEAEKLAARLKKEAGVDVKQQITLAFRLATGRTPSPVEVSRCVDLIQSLQTKDGAKPEQAMKYFCLTVLNLNEFVFVD